MKTIVAMLTGLALAGTAWAGQVGHTVTHKMEGYVTLFKVVSPEGAQCRVESDSSWFGTKDFEVPFKFRAQDKFYYTFDCGLPDGSRWRKRLEPKAHYTNIIRIGQGHASAPAMAPASSGGGAIGKADFKRLLKSIQNASFEDEKIQVLQLAVEDRLFTVRQVGKLVDAFDFSDGKVKVVELTSGRLLDRRNRYQILERFDFESDKTRAKSYLQ
jgi:hypothetical protein